MELLKENEMKQTEDLQVPIHGVVMVNMTTTGTINIAAMMGLLQWVSVIIVTFQTVAAQGTPECVYRYEEQPRTNLECNPYLSEIMILSCWVEGPNQLAINIRWFRVPLNTQQLQRLNPSPGKYRITTRIHFTASSHGRRSRLGVLQLSDSDAGRYFCQAELSNGTLLTPSNELILDVQSTYTVSAACSDGQLTTESTSCASIVTEDTVTEQSTTGNTDVITISLYSQPFPTTHVHQPSTEIVTTPIPIIQTYSNMELPANNSLWIYIVAPLTGVLCVTIISLLVIFMAVMIHMRKKTLSTNAGAPHYSQPFPQIFPLHESADGDYIDPSAASPLYDNHTPEAANTEMGPPDERKEVYQSLNPTSVDYTSLYMTTNMQGSVAPTVQERGREYVIIDSRNRDPPNLYATATTN